MLKCIEVENVLVDNKIKFVELEIYLYEYYLFSGIVEFISGWSEMVCYIEYD